MASRPVHYVLSTHWDREFYQTFQDFRFLLVKLLDQIIAGWESQELKGPFHTDGQAIILEDYLEIRPERREQVIQYLKEGKLLAGPWYVLPDEFLVSGESLIRNLAFGRQLVRSLGGKPSNSGFLCDMFGQNSQMPQIFAGFGIHGAFIWRGLNVNERLLRWIGADGTEIPSYRFGPDGYCDYAIRLRRIDNPKFKPELEQTAEEIMTFIEGEAAVTQVEPILIFDGADLQEWDEEVYSSLKLLMDQANEAYSIQHTSLDAYLAEMLPLSENITTTISGELRDPGYLPLEAGQPWIFPGVLSSRVWIKQANAICQTLLCHWAEPISVTAHALTGYDYPKGFLDVAWKWLLINHPHDSICGTSIDAVHEDMRYRFHQCRDIANRLASNATYRLAASIEGMPGENEFRLVVFNPLPILYEQPAELELDIPVEWPIINEYPDFEPKPDFKIYDKDGTEVPYQRLGQIMNQSRLRLFALRLPQNFKVNVIRVSVPLKIPAMGFVKFTIKSGKPGIPTRYSDVTGTTSESSMSTGIPSRYSDVPGMATSERSMSNGILSITFESNGFLSITDLRNGQNYNRLLTFEDRADIGRGGYHGIATNDQIFASTGCPTFLALINNGPLLTTFRVRTVMTIPAEFDFSTMQRSGYLKELVVDSLVSLRRGSDRVEVETTINNTVGDHRLRALFPTGCLADTFLTDTPFDVVEREIALRPDNHLYRELEVEARPQQTFSAIYRKPRGLAIVSTGLMEVACQDLPERPIALTLYRSTRRTIFTQGETEGQLFGNLTFHYWILPLDGDPDRAKLCLEGQSLAAGIRYVQLASVDVISNRLVDNLPVSASFLKIDGPVVMTSLREVTDHTEIRLFNPNPFTVQATLDFSGQPSSSKKFSAAQPVDFESNPMGPKEEFDGKQLTLTMNSKRILTLRFN